MPCFELTALKFQSINEIARWLITNDLLFWVPGEEKQGGKEALYFQTVVICGETKTR